MSKIAFLFSGQGAQYPGMMKEFYDTIPAAKEVFDVADRTLGRSISDLCFNGTEEDLQQTHNTQPCMLAADLAAYAAIREQGSQPDVVAGFSLGEYAALVAADALDMADAFRLVQIRADAMQAAVPADVGGMMVIKKCPSELAVKLCRQVKQGYVQPANFNQPMQVSISGNKEGLSELKQIAKEAGYKAVPLPVSAPFHCKLMQPAADILAQELHIISFSNACIPAYTNCDAAPTLDGKLLKDKLIRQVSEPVLWEQILIRMAVEGVDTFIEIGPGETLAKFTEKTLAKSTIYHVENIETLRSITAAFAR